MKTRANQPRNAALEGLQRAFARDVPEGYEQSSAWTAPGSGMQLYAQREQDRIQALNDEAHRRMALTGEWEPDREASTNVGLPGLVEGIFHTDIASGIDPSGQVVQDPREVRLAVPRRMRGVRGTIDDNAAYRAMKAYSREKR